jgi:hypothetical protein
MTSHQFTVVARQQDEQAANATPNQGDSAFPFLWISLRSIWPLTFTGAAVLNELLKLIKDAGSLHGRLVLVVGQDACVRSRVLADVSAQLNTTVLPLGIQLARRAAMLSRRQRPLQAGSLLRDVVDASFQTAPVAVLDRTEVLFDRSLRLDALDALKKLAHARTVVAAWPGELRNGRLLYAQASHPEHCDHAVAGCLVHQIT